MSNSDTVHVPVLPAEVTEWLAPKPGSVLIDGTFGGGGHARLLAQLVGDDGLVIGCDRDPKVIEKAESSGSFLAGTLKLGVRWKTVSSAACSGVMASSHTTRSSR